MERFDLICLGCGPAGEKAATQAAYYGKRVAVIERLSTPGGAMVNTGTIPSKALRETAVMCSAFRRRPVLGLQLQVEEDMTVPRFMAQRHLIQQEEHDRIERSFDRHNIAVLPGHGRIVDPHTIAVATPTGEEVCVQGDYILIATGSRPYRPAHVPFHHPAVVDADGILEIDHMPRRMLIVGGGVIGCEYACIFAEIGTQVTLVEPRDRMLPFIDDEIRSVLMRAMKDVDISTRLTTEVTEIIARKGEPIVRANFSGETYGEFDTVLWAAGRTGNSDGIGLENVHITPDKRGSIDVNEHYQTSVPSIYAAGDIIGSPMLTSTSMEQGRVAACHMFNVEFKKQVAQLFPIGLYTIPPIAAVGESEAEMTDSRNRIVVGRAPYRLNARGRMYRDNAGLFKLIFDRATGRLLGASIVGEQATELIHIAQAVMAAGQGIDYFINACFNYPSISDLYKYAAYDALQRIDADVSRCAA